MEYRIVWVKGHVEVWDDGGNFLFSADTEAEALADLLELSLVSKTYLTH